jgi:hypothetical protein
VVKVKKGINHILLRCDNNAGAWEFAVRVPLDIALPGCTGQRTGGIFDQVIQAFGHTEIPQRRTEKHRRLLASDKRLGREFRTQCTHEIDLFKKGRPIRGQRGIERGRIIRIYQVRLAAVPLLAAAPYAELAVVQMIDPLETRPHAGRPGYRHAMNVEFPLDLVQQIERRLRTAREELKFAHRYKHRVVNDDLQTAVREICDILAAREARLHAR